MKLSINILMLLCFANVYSSNPYHLDNLLPLNLWGWINESNKQRIAQLIQQHHTQVIVELGSWLGAFTQFIAENSDKDAKIYAIDVWEETPECKAAMSLSEQESKKFFSKLYHQFLSNIIHLNMQDKIIPIKMTTLEAAQKIDIIPDLVYVDASHTENDVYNDIKYWYPKIVSGGIMCGDDWSWDSVRRGVTRIAQELGQTIHVDNNFWWFNPKN